jgi:hypothetical protein
MNQCRRPSLCAKACLGFVVNRERPLPPQHRAEAFLLRHHNDDSETRNMPPVSVACCAPPASTATLARMFRACAVRRPMREGHSERLGDCWRLPVPWSLAPHTHDQTALRRPASTEKLRRDDVVGSSGKSDEPIASTRVSNPEKCARPATTVRLLSLACRGMQWGDSQPNGRVMCPTVYECYLERFTSSIPA